MAKGKKVAAFKDIYEEYGKRLYGFIFSLTGDYHLTEEIMQETFYQVFLHIDKFEGRCSIYTWICQIAKNTWYKEVRRKKRFDDFEIDSLKEETVESTVEEEIIKKDQCKRIREALKDLEEPYKDVFILHVLGEIKLKEIADMYGKSESWAKVTYLRAKEKIKRMID